MLRPGNCICEGPASEAGLDALGEGTEIGDALKFVVGQLDVEMLFDAGEQVQRLKAVDAELLEEIVVGTKLRARHFEVLRGELKNLVSGRIECHEPLSCHKR